MSDSNTAKIILAIGAHPDDVEFGCGATMAKLAAEKHKLVFAICTDGNRGSRQHAVEKVELIASRKAEQQAAAKILGASEVIFLDEEDGNLVSDIHFKEKIVRLIRRVKPDMVFTHDPSWFYAVRTNGIAAVNHTDHRACGAAVLDAVYPLARDLQSFTHHAIEGLEPHIVPELYLFNYDQPGFSFDVTGFVDTKIESIKAHLSQIDDPQAMADRITTWHKELGQRSNLQFAETFTQLKFS